MQLKASDTTYETCLSVTTSPDRLVDFVFLSYEFRVMMNPGKGLKSKGAKTTKHFAFSVPRTNSSYCFTKDITTIGHGIFSCTFLSLKHRHYFHFSLKIIRKVLVARIQVNSGSFCLLFRFPTIISSDYPKKTDNKCVSEIKTKHETA